MITRDNKIISQGYNGFPEQIKSIVEDKVDRETKYQYVVHAEVNTLINAEVSIRDCSIYVHGLPICTSCASILIRAGIKRVVMSGSNFFLKSETSDFWLNQNKVSQLMFHESKIDVIIL